MPTQSRRSLVRELTYKYKNRAEIFSGLDFETQVDVLLRLSRYVQSQLIAELDTETILPILEYLDPDDATDILQTTSKKKQKELLGLVSNELQTKISMLLQFDPSTAAGLMSLNYILVQAHERLSSVTEQIHTHEERTGKLPVVIVMEDGHLLGYLPVQELIFAKPGDYARQYAEKIRTVKYTSTSETVINQFLEHPHQKMVVMGENGGVLGVIYSDDVLRVLQEEEASNLYDFAGVSNEETIFGSVKQKVKYRYKWLIINLGTAFFASFIVGLFNETISKYVLLAVYMPIVAGMGGNSATQTLAVLVRGIALKQIELGTALPTLKRELGASLIHGIINGLLVALVVIIFNRDFRVGLILAVAMVANLLVAGFFGTLVPLVMAKLKKDPATSATIFITTATDVLGFLVFLGLGSLFLK